MLQLFDNKYPYTDFHELNLDWIISRIIQMDHKLSNFVSLNTIKYADPIAWDITTQYATNTIVIDPATGVAYISTQPVPVGVPLLDTNYWTVVFDLTPLINMFTGIRDQISLNYEETYTSTHNYSVGDWLFVHNSVTGKDLLYIVTLPITINGGIIPDFNVRKVTVEEIISEVITSVENLQVLFEGIREQISVNYEDSYTSTHNYSVGEWLFIHDSVTGKDLLYEVILPVSINDMLVSGTNISKVTIEDLIGNLRSLTTANKASIVSAINELDSDIGDLSNLDTNIKTSVVDSINEVCEDWICYRNIKRYGAKGDGITDDTDAIKAAVADGEGVIYFPPGVYVVSDTISITTNGITLLGSGFTPLDEPAMLDGEATILLSKFDGHVIEVARTAYHFTMKGFRIHKLDADADDTQTNSVGVYLKNWVWFYHLEDIYVTNMYHGIASGGTNFALIKHCIARNNYKHGFYFNNKIEDEFAIDATRAMQVDVIDCLSENNNGSGFYYEHGNTTATGSMPVGAFVNNKTFANKEYGVLFLGQDGTKCVSAVRCSNLFLGNDGKGCLIIKWVAFPSTFEHLQIEQAGTSNCGRKMLEQGNPSFGITVNTGSINASFNNCMISGNSRSGMYIAAELTKINGCTFYNNNRLDRAGEGSILSASTNSVINGCSFSETSNGIAFSVDNNSIVTSNNFYHVSGVPISGHTTYITQANNVMP